MDFTPTFTKEEEHFLSRLCWYQENRDSITADFEWLAREFGLSWNGVRQRFRRYKKLGFVVRCQIGQREWLTRMTDKALDWWRIYTQKRTQKRTQTNKKKETSSIYIEQVKSNKLSGGIGDQGIIDSVFSSAESLRFQRWVEENNLNPNQKHVREATECDLMEFLMSTCGYMPNVAEMAVQATKRAVTVKTNIFRYALATAKKVEYNISRKSQRRTSNASP